MGKLAKDRLWVDVKEVQQLTEKEPLFQVGEEANDETKGLFGKNPRFSLQSVNFAPGENRYLSEHYEQKITEGDE